MIEGFNNPNWMLQADRVLKEIGREKAQEYYKVKKTHKHQPVLRNLLGILQHFVHKIYYQFHVLTMYM